MGKLMTQAMTTNKWFPDTHDLVDLLSTCMKSNMLLGLIPIVTCHLR